MGWSRELPFRRLHLVMHNTRLLVLGSSGLGANLRQLNSGVRQVCRVQHRTRKMRWGPTPTEMLSGFPSWEPERASALRRLRLPCGS